MGESVFKRPLRDIHRIAPALAVVTTIMCVGPFASAEQSTEARQDARESAEESVALATLKDVVTKHCALPRPCLLGIRGKTPKGTLLTSLAKPGRVLRGMSADDLQMSDQGVLTAYLEKQAVVINVRDIRWNGEAKADVAIEIYDGFDIKACVAVARLEGDKWVQDRPLRCTL